MNEENPQDMLPLQPIIFYVLFALVGKVLHGYEIKKIIESEMGKSTPTATVYRYFRNMQESNMIEETDKPKENDDPRRQYFKLTPFGQAVYAAEYNRMAQLVANAPAVGGAEQPV